jgi:CRP/FNR family transcriptional regulator
MNHQEILSQYEFYGTGSEPLRHELETHGSQVQLAQGEMFVRHGERCDHYALVGQGRLRVFATNELGREITFYYVTPGDTCLLSAACLVSGAPLPASARADAPVVALLYTGDVFRRWLDEYPTVREHVLRQIATHMTDMMSLVTDVAFLSMDKRLASWLAGRFRETEAGEPSIFATHEKIAAEIGTAREVVSRLLKEFERQGIVTLSRSQVTLRDAEALRRLTSQG